MAPMKQSNEPQRASSVEFVHHIGTTVVDLEKSIDFWERFLGVASRGRRLLDAPHVGGIVGHPGVVINMCWVDLPGGDTALELLHYQNRDGTQLDDDTIHQGNVHLCFQVRDIDAAWTRAVSCGARPVSNAPIDILVGPAKGGRAAYLRNPDGVTIELLQPAEHD